MIDREFIVGVICTIAGIFIGNYDGDRATLHDCATHSTAKMVGGGTIKCEVVKEQQP